MQAYYAARATEYDAVYLKPERQADLRNIERWVATLYARRNVLEIACGTGYWTQFIAPLASHVTAIDAAPEVIRIAKGRVPEGKVEFLVCDAYDPPRGRPFDAAFAGFWFSHVPKSRQREFLVRLGEALEPGAQVVLLDNLYVDGSSSPIVERDVEGNTYQRRTLSDGSVHRVLKNFPTHAELNSLVSGLSASVVITEWPYFWAVEYMTAEL
jgi:SAM-dependent methyltransferase